MLVFLFATPFVLGMIITSMVINRKRDCYIKTTKSYIRNVLFFRLKKQLLESKNLDDEGINDKITSLIDDFISRDHNLTYRVLIDTQNEERFITINIMSKFKKAFYTINESCVFRLTNN